ncbi:hypothetical protein JCM19238_5123 [Vibrio ponticus]|nr:hypothetical protein JCM19238_5123 [Vibrio ponticus]
MKVGTKRSLLSACILGAAMAAPQAWQMVAWSFTAVRPMLCVKQQPKLSLKNTM